MSAKFVFALEGGTKELKDAISKRLKEAEYGFWHYIENLWLIDHAEDDISARQLSDWLEQTPGLTQQSWVVLRVDDGSGDYWGRAVKGAWDWMAEEWAQGKTAPGKDPQASGARKQRSKKR